MKLYLGTYISCAYDVVAYSLKARIMESQQLAVARQRPINNKRGIVFSARSVPMAAQATVDYIMPPLNNNCAATEKWCFLCDPCQDILSRTVSKKLVGQSVEWCQLVGE
jgi:hypothetical protein